MKSFYSPCKRKLPNIRQLRHLGGLNQKRNVNNFTQTNAYVLDVGSSQEIIRSTECKKFSYLMQNHIS